MASRTKLTKTLLWTAAVLMTTAAPAVAQDTAFLTGLRPIELSIGGAGVLSVPTSGGSVRIQLSVPLDDRRSLEIYAGPYLGTINNELGSRIRASFGFQFTRRLNVGRRPGLELFATSGAEGAITQQDTFGCSAPGTVCAPRTRTEVIPPLVGLFGLGMHKVLSPHLALRVEAQALCFLFVPFGARAGISLSIPLGQTYETVTRTVRR